jgi:lipoprotein signal peptidase
VGSKCPPYEKLQAAGSFNVADSAITVGAACLILDELLRVRGGR